MTLESHPLLEQVQALQSFALQVMYVDGEHVPRDPEKAARLIGLERTADLWRDGEGPKAPGFLFSAPRPDGEAEASRPIAKDEYSPAEMDAFFGPEGAIT